ncbi:hypothetical protein [Aliikangiella sp. IMCC44359]|uniref:hypothetical protein n=1 Tax=Aliikangiella sp. IMCC44359 TaxID=3459125 RepID=UPI00403A8042
MTTSTNCRLGYLVVPKPGLFKYLQKNNPELIEYFKKHYSVVTEELDYEEYFEGPKGHIIDACKSFFIEDTIGTVACSGDYSKGEVEKLFGNFGSPVELFDKWWSFAEMDCSQVPTKNWLNK